MVMLLARLLLSSLVNSSAATPRHISRCCLLQSLQLFQTVGRWKVRVRVRRDAATEGPVFAFLSVCRQSFSEIGRRTNEIFPRDDEAASY